MKTLAAFKRRLEVGVRMKIDYHAYITKDRGFREISILKKMDFALKTQKLVGIEVIHEDQVVFYDSWVLIPKASMVKFPTPNSMQVWTRTYDNAIIGNDKQDKLDYTITFEEDEKI